MVAHYNAVITNETWAALRGMDVSPSNTWPGIGETIGGNEFKTNIITFTNLTTLHPSVVYYPYNFGYQLQQVYSNSLASNVWDYNTLYHAGTTITNYYAGHENYSWAMWTALGADPNSVIGDPLLNTNTWQLDGGSPALALGFQQIPFSSIGCYYSTDRATWPLGQGGMRYLRAGTIRAGTLRGP
jgi:hypothetical protein